MIDNLTFFGNPEAYANWYDEHLNKILKATCRFASQFHFEGGVLDRMRHLLKIEFDRLRRKPKKNPKIIQICLWVLI